MKRKKKTVKVLTFKQLNIMGQSYKENKLKTFQLNKNEKSTYIGLFF